MSRYFLLLTLLAATPAAAQAQVNEDSPTAFRRGVELHQKGDIEGAIREYRESLRLDPNQPQALSNLGAALSAQGRFGDAIAQYQAALHLAPDLPGVRLNLALAYYKSNQIAEAAGLLTVLHGAQPGDLRVTLLLADCRLRLGEFPAVIALLTPLEAANAGNRGLDYMLGMALIRNGQIDEGQKRVDRILRDGDSAEAHYLLGSASFMSHDFPAAAAEFAKAIALNPDLPSLHSYYGQCLLSTGDPDGASAAFHKALEQDPHDFDANLQLASILAQRKQFAAALPLVERATEARPNSPDAHFALANLLRETGRSAEAEAAFAYVSKTWPGYRPAHEQAAPSHLGALAPDFTLRSPGSSRAVHLADFRGKKPVVLVFGSYTCPQFRYGSGPLEKLHAQYGTKAEFLLVYIREAHGAGGGQWKSTQNQREGVDLSDATSIEAKRKNAAYCVRALGIPYAAVVDGMDLRVETAYQAWPSRVFVVGKDGRIVFESLLDERSFDPAALASAIEKSAR